MGHQTEPESTLRYARLRTLHVVNVARRGTLTHYAEAAGHPYTCWRHKTTVIHSLRSLHKTKPGSRDCTVLHTMLFTQVRVTTGEVQQPQDCTSLQTGCQQTVNISNQPGLYSLKTPKSTRWMFRSIQGQDAM